MEQKSAKTMKKTTKTTEKPAKNQERGVRNTAGTFLFQTGAVFASSFTNG
jgi:hypothetical protein